MEHVQHEQKASTGPMNGTGVESSLKPQPQAFHGANRVQAALQRPKQSWMRSCRFAPWASQGALVYSNAVHLLGRSAP